MTRSRALIRLYVGVVAIVGAGVLVGLAFADRAGGVFDLVVPLLVVAAVLGEMWPLQISIGHEHIVVTTARTFALALMVTAGPLVAALTLVGASLVADRWARRPWWRTVFNASQYAIALGVAALVASALGATVPMHLAATHDVLAYTVCALAFFLVNFVLVGVGASLGRRVPLSTVFRHDFAKQAASNVALLALAPVVVVVGEFNALLLPLLLAPLWIAYKHVAESLEKEHQALHDPLTGLPNRTLFRAHIAEAISTARYRSTVAALLLLDLDGFKAVNDTLGHQAGDRLLQELGPRLRTVVREGDVVSRLGGDEFAIWLSEVDTEASTLRVAGEILEVLRAPVMLDGSELRVDASLGIALYPEHGTDVDVLLQRADIAMYASKDLRNGPVTYSGELDHNSPLQLALVGELRRAVEDVQLIVEYQPKIELATGRPVGMESLVRWEHPTRGRIEPHDFIPLAEQTGLIRDLTACVLTEALRQCRSWHELEFDVPVAVNVSARILHDDALPRVVSGILDEVGVPPDWLMLEITESMIMTDPERSIDALEQLRALGVRLSVDDYGTGHASLAYLKRLPVTEMKIDQTFVTRMADDPRDVEITKSTILLGKRLGLDVVAEGVETGEVAELLATMGCPNAQGYYYSRPLPPGELIRWLQRTKSSPEAVRGAAVVQPPEPAPASPRPRTPSVVTPLTERLA